MKTMKTTIYSCGAGTTSEYLMATTHGDVDVWFPEVRHFAGRSIPLHESEQFKLLPELRGKTIVTVSETIILMFLHEIRHGRMRTDGFELYCNGRHIEVDVEGSFLDPWDGGFFELGFTLRFNDVS